GRRWDVDGERRLAGSEHGGGVAPVRFGRGEVAWELREVEAVLRVGAVGVERVWGGGSTAGWSSPGFKQGGGGVLRRGSDERAKGCAKSSSGTLVVCGRSLEESGGLCRERSTAASRWRPSGRFWKRRGGVARGGGASAKQQEGRRSSATRGRQRTVE